LRNAKATQERILEAAMVEFSAYGIAGARVDRIAKTAGCNKNLIYMYFKSKEKLFTTVLQKHLTDICEYTTFTPEDLPGYATRLFDFAMTHPDLMRLMAWFSLEQKMDNPDERREAYNLQVAALMKAQSAGQEGTDFSTDFLWTTIVTLATAWTATNPFGPSLNPDVAKNLAMLKDAIARAVKLITKGEAKTK
jgi:AcrR family transcriptional regulator